MVTKIDAPIVSVTLMEDRAHVSRKTRVELAAGNSRLRLQGLAPVLADKTLAARFEEAEGLRVVDASVTRDVVVLDEEKPEGIRDLDQRVEALERTAEELARGIERTKASLAGLSTRADVEIDEICDDARFDRADGERWKGMIDSVGASEEALAAELARLSESHRQNAIKLGDVAHQRAIASTPSGHLRADVSIDIDATEATTATLIVEYVVPAACWRPYHTARWLADDRVVFATDACVWQNTGEDWDGAKLSFSTERPSLGASPPKLASDVVRAMKKGPDVEVGTREEEIQTAGLGGGGTVTMPDLPGIDDGGDPMLVAAPHPATVPSDGHPVRVPLGLFHAEAKADLTLMPELALAVIARTELPNAGERPLLPGPVDLIRNGGLIGRTTVDYVAPGERFELGWGPDATLRVARDVRQLEDETRMLSSWTKMPRVVELQISNIGTEDKNVAVTERVLVSEVEKVKVEVDAKKSTGAVSPDRDGMVHWNVDVPPNGKKKIELRYIIEKHDDVVGL